MIESIYMLLKLFWSICVLVSFSTGVFFFILLPLAFTFFLFFLRSFADYALHKYHLLILLLSINGPQNVINYTVNGLRVTGIYDTMLDYLK